MLVLITLSKRMSLEIVLPPRRLSVLSKTTKNQFIMSNPQTKTVVAQSSRTQLLVKINRVCLKVVWRQLRHMQVKPRKAIIMVSIVKSSSASIAVWPLKSRKNTNVCIATSSMAPKLLPSCICARSIMKVQSKR